MYALLAAEDPDDSAIFSMVLQRAGLAVTTTKTLDVGLQSWLERPTDIILLALSTPSPQKQVQNVRAETQVPLIVAVGSISEQMHVELLKLGADLIVVLRGGKIAAIGDHDTLMQTSTAYRQIFSE